MDTTLTADTLSEAFNRPRRRRTRLIDEALPEDNIPKDLYIDRNNIMPNLEMMVANGKVYTAEPIGVKVQNIIDHLRGFYNAKYRDLKAIEEDREYQTAMAQWQGQLDSIHRSRNRGTILVPPDMIGMPVMVYSNSLCFLRYERFYPDEISGPASYFREKINNISGGATKCKKILEFVKDIPSDKKVLMKIKQEKIDFTLAFAFSPTQNLIFNPFQKTFHTMSSGKLCIGETNAKEFWHSPIFTKMINRINIYSPARYDFSFVENGASKVVSLYDLITDKYMTDIQKVEDEKWKV